MISGKHDKKSNLKPILAVIVLIVLIGSIGAYMMWGTDDKPKQTTTDAEVADEVVVSNDKYDTYMTKNTVSSSGEQSNQDITAENNSEEKSTEKGDTVSDDDFVDGLMEQMSLSEKIYQMMFVRPESLTGVSPVTAAGEATGKALARYPVGGVVYFGDNLESRKQTADMISGIQGYSPIPLFIAVDEEGGIVSRLGSNPAMGTKKQPPMKQIGESGDKKAAYEVGETLAADLSSLGFNVDFAPVADVIVNEKNSEIGSRSFGSDPKLVSGMVENAVAGLEDNNVSATLKHFPGHGSTYVNSHNGRSESTRTLEELRKCEFLPFVAGIEKDVDFIMISHMTLVNATEEKVPCSVSKEVITDMLIDELGYEGIIITDSFEMGAVTDEYTQDEAVVKAVDAGVDMILMTPDIKGAHDAIYNAIMSGKLTEDRIDISVRKILSLKYEKGMMIKK